METIEYTDGGVYKGETKKLKKTKIKEGLGIYYAADGSVYFGEWDNDVYHG